jgi:hypothetical protein
MRLSLGGGCGVPLWGNNASTASAGRFHAAPATQSSLGSVAVEDGDDEFDMGADSRRRGGMASRNDCGGWARRWVQPRGAATAAVL